MGGGDGSRWARQSPGRPGSRWSRWGLCSSARGFPGAARGRLGVRPGTHCQIGPRLRGCEPASGTEGPRPRWRRWLREVRWGTGCGPECSQRSTCCGGRRQRRAPRLNLYLCSAGERREETHTQGELKFPKSPWMCTFKHRPPSLTLYDWCLDGPLVWAPSPCILEKWLG